MNTLEKSEQGKRAGQGRRVEFVAPRVNLHQDADGYTLEVEMPGVAKDGVEMTVEEGKLILSGHRRDLPGLGQRVHQEQGDFDYRRVFDLDPGIDAGKIEAHMDQGLLKVRLPKAEAVKPRKIQVS